MRKFLKKFIYVLIVSLMLYVILYLLRSTNDSNPLNTKLTNQGTPIAQIESNNIKKKTKKRKSEASDKAIELNQVVKTTTKEKTTPESDYVSAYRDWQYFENCYTDVEDFNNKKDPLQTQAERFNNNRESQSEPTPQQNSYYQYHVDVCKSLISIADDSKEYYVIRDKLKSRYEKIIPKSEKAKQLQHALTLVQQLNGFKLEYTRAMSSASALSADSINEIQQKINALSDELMSIYEAGEELSQQQISDIETITTEITRLKTNLRTNSAPDSNALAEIEAKINGHLNSIDDYLHRVQSPDAFLVLANVLYKIEYFAKQPRIIETLKSQTGIYDNYYINILNQIVLPLVACSMDYPCDAQSDLILSYCLGLRDSMFNQACGRSLEDFYFNFYIGENQLNDVNIYFNYLVNKYAH